MADLGMTLDGGYLPLVPPNASPEAQIIALNKVIERINLLMRQQVFMDDSNRRFVQGYVQGRWPGGDFGIAISEPGQDVFDAAFEDLLFAWDFTTNSQYSKGGEQTHYDDEGNIIFQLDTKTWKWFESDGRNYINLGLRSSGSYGFEMAKPGETLGG